MPIVNKKLSSVIAEATQLNREIKERTAKLDALKVIIRNEANKVATKADSDEKLEFESDAGICSVSFVSDSVSFTKDANPIALKETLPEDIWNCLFVEEVKLSKEFKETFVCLNKGHQSIVSKIVQAKSNEPRVTLPR